MILLCGHSWNRKPFTNFNQISKTRLLGGTEEKSYDLFGRYKEGSEGDPGGQRVNGTLGMAFSNESSSTVSH